MDKTVYSLVLAGEVVAAIDRMAAREGRSRSAYINAVLAQHAGLTTPEASRRALSAAVRSAAEASGLRASATPAGTLTLHTALRYRYNPSLQVALHLHDGGAYLGEVRVGLRSQSEDLLGYMQLFFELWGQLERKHLPCAPECSGFDARSRRYRRLLRRPAAGPGGDASEEMAREITAWVSMLDESLNVYLENLDDAEAAIAATEAAYRRALARLGLASEF